MPRSLEELTNNARKNTAAFERELPPSARQEASALPSVMSRMNAKVILRLKPIYAVADKFGDAIAPHIACKKGCNHCCHLRVPLNEVEAQLMGANLSIKPQVPRRTQLKDENSYGRHTPCTFLEDGACSIYEHRPLACRVHSNLDVDDEACSTGLDGTDTNVFVPTPNIPAGIQEAYDIVYKLHGGVVVADIRDIFPNGRKT